MISLPTKRACGHLPNARDRGNAKHFRGALIDSVNLSRLPEVFLWEPFYLICTLWIMMIFEVELDGLRIILLILINSNTMLSLHDFVDCYFR